MSIHDLHSQHVYEWLRQPNIVDFGEVARLDLHDASPIELDATTLQNEMASAWGHWDKLGEVQDDIRRNEMQVPSGPLEFEAKERVRAMLSERLAARFAALGLGPDGKDIQPESTPAPAQSPATPAHVETVEQRRARYLTTFEAEEKRLKRGALQRVADSEGVDRSNMSKDIAKARSARDKQNRDGPAWTSQLFQDGKRKSRHTRKLPQVLPGFPMK